MKPTVSACIITYNQEEFIQRTLQSVQEQQIKGVYEIVVGDDVSTDATLEIVTELAKNDPRVRILPSDNNVGMHRNWARTISACEGKYIAICEGDDFWNDQDKLQKQIELLENDVKAAACFSNAHVIGDDGTLSIYPYVDKAFTRLSAESFFELNLNPIPTCTIVFRRSFLKDFPAEYYKSPFADWILHAILIQQGHYLYLPELTSTYRKHEAGVWSGVKEETQLRNKLKALQIIEKLVKPQFRKAIRIAIGKQLDGQLYFYRRQGDRFHYFKTWLRLKLLTS